MLTGFEGGNTTTKTGLSHLLSLCRLISLSEEKKNNFSRLISLHPPTPKLRTSKEGVGGGASLSLGPLACGGLITPISG